jgi:ribulose 1,5-bisphosphate carboxylase large subunit-like protein
MTQWIEVIARARVTKLQGGGPVAATQDECAAIARQMAADAVYGSFGEFSSDYWKGRLTGNSTDFAIADIKREEDSKVRINLKINSGQYQMIQGGLQHFLGVLAGDLFFLRIPGFEIDMLRVSDVKFPESMVNSLKALFRKEARSTERVRSAFALEADEPLMAFSIKPRVGLTREALREVVLGVLEAGFHIAEFDTRYLDLTPDNVQFLQRLAKEAADVGGEKKRITRLSPNISVSAKMAIDFCKDYQKYSDWPYVVKVDGGFDGLSTIQSLRQAFSERSAPIITCYPLLRDQLQNRIPHDFFVSALALSGADIIYPGQSPSIGGGTRELGTAEKTAVSQATKRYSNFVKEGWPMVTLAGGVYAGQLQCLYELVGPQVAFFLGGAVSLHKGGPIEGAHLCKSVVREAARSHNEDKKKIKDLPGGLIKEVEAAYEKPAGASESVFSYFSAKDFLAQIDVPRW